MNKNIVIAGLSFLIYILVQILLLKHVVLFDMAFCFIYITVLLLLPFETGNLGLMFIAALLGLIIDVFYDSLGIHMAACVLVAFLRPVYISLVTPRGGYDVGSLPLLKDMGFEWFSIYSFALIFVHHLMIFFIEASGFDMFFLTLLKAFLSTLFTWFVVVVFQYLFYKPKRSI